MVSPDFLHVIPVGVDDVFPVLAPSSSVNSSDIISGIILKLDLILISVEPYHSSADTPTASAKRCASSATRVENKPPQELKLFNS